MADRLISDDSKCVGCQRCVVFCPKNAIVVRPTPSFYRPNASWSREKLEDLKKQAETGGVILTGCGNDKPFRIYWDHIVLNASQVTNPSIDPLREPMELRTFLGAKPDLMEISADNGEVKISTEISPNLMVETPILFSAMSYGAISYNAFRSLATAACKSGTYFNTGEGGPAQRDEGRVRKMRHSAGSIRALRHRRRVPQLRPGGGDQGGPGSQARHRRAPARREGIRAAWLRPA